MYIIGRAGYGATLEGTVSSSPLHSTHFDNMNYQWPYTYDACDVGTAPNQTLHGLPVAATQNGDPGGDGALSYLPGQRLSRCTCPDESHPGPIHSDGTYVGRSAPEIDILEAQVRAPANCDWLDAYKMLYKDQRRTPHWSSFSDSTVGCGCSYFVHLSGLIHPPKPFNAEYKWLNTSDNLIVLDPTISTLNTYIGGDTQQATSIVTNTGVFPTASISF